MNRSMIAKLTRWFASAMLVACALTYAAPSQAAPFKRLFSFLNRTGPAGCASDASGNAYYADAWGYNSSLSNVCNSGTTGSTAQTLCPNSAVWHQVYVEKLQSSGIMYVLSTGPLQQTWTNTQAAPAYNIPATSSCPAGNTATASAWGRAYP